MASSFRDFRHQCNVKVLWGCALQNIVGSLRGRAGDAVGGAQSVVIENSCKISRRRVALKGFWLFVDEESL